MNKEDDAGTDASPDFTSKKKRPPPLSDIRSDIQRSVSFKKENSNDPKPEKGTDLEVIDWRKYIGDLTDIVAVKTIANAT